MPKNRIGAFWPQKARKIRLLRGCGQRVWTQTGPPAPP
ncbi:hypothetical protein J2X01_002369 [Arthrobacter ginsengisoli]|uniref:Uncharacterized protein n=1 Tax=Arthrobacter ginsengisoli TaxID=1356565 RepID=A0ABU1UD11_9MICC|nr:hypothetical protein [Arthrobacter ginsengisoli]